MTIPYLNWYHWINTTTRLNKLAGSRINEKMMCHHYREPIVEITRSDNLLISTRDTGKASSLYWIRPRLWFPVHMTGVMRNAVGNYAHNAFLGPHCKMIIRWRNTHILIILQNFTSINKFYHYFCRNPTSSWWTKNEHFCISLLFHFIITMYIYQVWIFIEMHPESQMESQNQHYAFVLFFQK